jgi:hypothetical protein
MCIHFAITTYSCAIRVLMLSGNAGAKDVCLSCRMLTYADVTQVQKTSVFLANETPEILA